MRRAYIPVATYSSHPSIIPSGKSVPQILKSCNIFREMKRQMRKTFLILFAVCLSTWVMSYEVSAQSYNRVSEKNIKVVRGKKLVLTGAVRDGDEVVYRFRARAGQRVVVKIIGRDSDFSVYLNYGLDVEPVARDTKSWSGRMPPEFDGHCEIGVHSTYKVADYRLEISLK